MLARLLEASVLVSVWYDSKLLTPINTPYFHLSVFQGQGCIAVNEEELESDLMAYARDMCVTGFLSANPKLFQTSMRV